MSENFSSGPKEDFLLTCNVYMHTSKGFSQAFASFNLEFQMRAEQDKATGIQEFYLIAISVWLKENVICKC